MDQYPDLTTIDGVQRFLTSLPDKFACSSISPRLAGGSCNYVYRLILNKPLDGQDSLVLKYSPFVQVSEVVVLSTERQRYEVEGMKLARELVSTDALVNAPRVHYFDDQAHVIIMDDCGERSTTLKHLMLQGDLSLPRAERLGAVIGNFLGTVHKTGSPPSRTLEPFVKNKEAIEISIWLMYGDFLLSTLNGKAKLPDLLDPPFEVNKEDLDIISRLAESVARRLRDLPNLGFAMGDFWPGNVLVNLDERGEPDKALIVDWELAKAGIPALDVGQFCAELYMVEHFYPEKREISRAIAHAFLDAYEKHMVLGEEGSMTAAAHVGSHLVVWSPRVAGWGSKELVRKSVAKGIEILVKEDVQVRDIFS